MRLNKLKIVLFLLVFAQGIISCGIYSRTQNTPSKMLWAWERNEDLRYIDSKQIGVAYLAQTINLSATKVILIPRRQPLRINPDTFLIAVTRIETYRPTSAFSDNQLDETVKLITKSVLRKDVRGVQIDFDVKVSEREFYKKLLSRIRIEIPKDKTLSITALASFCIGDRWMKDLPIDEAVPMLFEMGADSKQIIAHLQNENDFNEPLCRSSYGFALYEPTNFKLRENRTKYYFNSRPWKPKDLEKIR